MSVRYPSYVGFDRFIDIALLSSLHEFLWERIQAHIRAEADSFFLNLHRLDHDTPYAPGVREIWLTQMAPGSAHDYVDLGQETSWRPAPAAIEFAPLMDFVATLPFKSTGRILIIYDDAGNPVPAHRDHENSDWCQEFIWMRTCFNKRFFLLNAETGEREYVQTHSAWFDTVNQFHGADGSDTLSFSIRVDGVFHDRLRAQIPFDTVPRSATPAKWAASHSGMISNR